MAIPLPHYLFAHFCDLLLVQLGIEDLTIMANLFPILPGMRDLAAIANLFPVLSVRDSILSTYLFLLLLGLRSLAVSLHLLMLRDLTMGLHLPTISLLPLVTGGYLLIMLLSLW